MLRFVIAWYLLRVQTIAMRAWKSMKVENNIIVDLFTVEERGGGDRIMYKSNVYKWIYVRTYYTQGFREENVFCVHS